MSLELDCSTCGERNGRYGGIVICSHCESAMDKEQEVLNRKVNRLEERYLTLKLENSKLKKEVKELSKQLNKKT